MIERELELLDQLVHEVLKEQRGIEFSEAVRWLHGAAADIRNGNPVALDALVSFLRDLPDAQIEPTIRACSLQLQLANIAEERERLRRRRRHDAAPPAQRESLAET